MRMPWPSPRLSAEDLALFAGQMASAMRLGWPLEQALASLSAEVWRRCPLQTLISSLRQDLAAGLSLATALAKYPRLFPPAYTSMIAAAQAAGNPTPALQEIRRHAEITRQVRSRAFARAAYPNGLVLALFALLLASIYRIMPSFQMIYDAMSENIAAANRGNGLLVLDLLWQIHRTIPFYALALVLLLIFLLFVVFQRKVFFAGWAHWLPMVGRLSQTLTLHRLLVTLSGLVSSGMSLEKAWPLAAQTAKNTPLEPASRTITTALATGQPLGQILSEHLPLEPLLAWHLSLSDRQGKTPQALQTLIRHYEDDLPRLVDRTVLIFDLALLGFVGTWVGLGIGLTLLGVLQWEQLLLGLLIEQS